MKTAFHMSRLHCDILFQKYELEWQPVRATKTPTSTMRCQFDQNHTDFLKCHILAITPIKNDPL